MVVAGPGVVRAVGRPPAARSWWQRWIVYAPRMPRWLRACRLTVADPGQPVTVQVTPFRRTAVQPRVRPRRDQVPRVVGVRSGPSWDEVRVRLVPGQTPEEFDPAARALAVARGVARCQVRELGPQLVSIDYQRCDRLATSSRAATSPTLADVAGDGHRPARVWSGRTEYGTDWLQPLAGGHTLTAGATGAGKNSVGWCPDRVDRPGHPRRAGAGVGDRPEGHGTGLRAPDLPPLRRHLQGRPRAAR